MLQQQSTATPSGERYAKHQQHNSMLDKRGTEAASSGATQTTLLQGQDVDNSSSERVTNRRPNTLLLTNELHTPVGCP